MKRQTLQIIINLLALAGAITMNVLATTLPLNGRTTGEISDSFNALFTPAGYVFAIWGLIYVSLIGYAVFQALPGQRSNPRLAMIGGWFALSCLANGLWILFWHYGLYLWTAIIMLTLLVSLIVIYQRINKSQLPVADSPTRWLVQFPFSLYLGWISVATIANISVLLLWWGWNGGAVSPVVWTVIMIGAAVVLSVLMRNVTYSGVIIWALIGIAVKQSTNMVIVIACAIAVLICLLGLGWMWRFTQRSAPLAR